MKKITLEEYNRINEKYDKVFIILVGIILLASIILLFFT